MQLGDLLCAIPAIRALKGTYPQAEITLIGLPWAEGFVKRFSAYFSAFIPFPGAPGLQEQPFQAERFIDYLKVVHQEKFDLLIQLHGNGCITNTIAAMAGSRQMAGYYLPGNYQPNKELFMPYPDDLPEIKRHLELMQFLGVPSMGEALEFPVFPEEKMDFKTLCNNYHLQPQEYVCVHPGARDARRWWAPQKFAKVANEIAKKGYKIVFTGTPREREIVETVLQHMDFPAVNLTGKTGLGVLALLIQNAKMLLSNDTGVSHIATAVKTPSVVIFLTSDPKRWAPLNKALHHIILPEESENIHAVLASTAQALQYKKSQNFALRAGEIS